MVDGWKSSGPEEPARTLSQSPFPQVTAVSPHLRSQDHLQGLQSGQKGKTQDKSWLLGGST